LCKRTVATAIHRLLSAGLIVRVRRGGLNQGPANYRIRGIPPG